MKSYLGIVFFMALLLVSCEMQKNELKDLTAATEQKDFLVFDDTEDFDVTLSNAANVSTKSQDVASFEAFNTVVRKADNSRYFTEEQLEDYESDHVLFQVLNKNRMVQIGPWICQLDFNAEQVYVVNQEDWATVQGNVLNQSSKAYSFSFEEEVSAYMDVAATEKVDLYKAKEIYLAMDAENENARFNVCPNVPGRDKAKENCSDLEYTSVVDGKTYSAKIKLVYQKVGIYFSVKAKVKNYRTWLGCNLNTGGMHSISYGSVLINVKKWRIRRLRRVCRDDYRAQHFAFSTHSEGGASDSNNSSAILTNTLYEGARGLQNLDVTAQFRWQSHVGNYSSFSETFNIRR